MAQYSDIVRVLREKGMSSMLSRDTANALYDKASASRREVLLGLQKLGQATKHDSMNIKFTGVETTKGVAKAVDLNARAVEIAKSGLATVHFGAITTKETISLDTENLIHINAASACNASDAQMEAVAKQVVHSIEDLVGRTFMLLEKSFWQGALGLMQIEAADGNLLQVPTNTVILPPLGGTDVWTDTANAVPLSDIDTMKATFRGTGLKPGNLIMNEVTYQAMVQTDAFKSDLGDNLRQSFVLGEDVPTIRGMGVQVYDEGYVDEAGVFTTYIPDGIVIAEGVSPLGDQTTELYDCVNVDDRAGKSYGSFVDVIEAHNPTRVSYYHSYYGAPIFRIPQAYVSLQVF